MWDGTICMKQFYAVHVVRIQWYCDRKQRSPDRPPSPPGNDTVYNQFSSFYREVIVKKDLEKMTKLRLLMTSSALEIF